VEKLQAAHRGQTSIMRLLPPLIAAALTVLAAAAAGADEPPTSTPLNLSAPSAGSDLPDMGSPAAAVLSHTDEYRLGAMVARELRDQNALLEDPEVSEYLNWVGLRLA
jgi:predicted Zn-dependent protease